MSRTRSVVITAAGRPNQSSRTPLDQAETDQKRAAKRRKRTYKRTWRKEANEYKTMLKNMDAISKRWFGTTVFDK